jgi:hypothetical protein
MPTTIKFGYLHHHLNQVFSALSYLFSESGIAKECGSKGIVERADFVQVWQQGNKACKRQRK